MTLTLSEDALLKFLIAAFDQITTEHYFNLNDKGDDTENKNILCFTFYVIYL